MAFGDDELGLLERECEREQLGRLLGTAAAGCGAVAVLEGPPGIGKSRLLDSWRLEARTRDMLALSARGARLEREFGFGVVRQLFEPALMALPAAVREELLAGSAARAAPIVTGREFASPIGPDDAHAVYHALYWLCSNLAERAPLALVVDDAQWADLPSVRFLAYLVQRVEDLPLALAFGIRSGHPEQLVRQVTGDAFVDRIVPRPLSAHAVARLVASQLAPDPDNRFTRACHSATGGNPFLLRELLTELRIRAVRPTADAVGEVEDLHSAGVSRAVVGRLLELPEAATRVARALAILGGEGDAALVAGLAGLDLELALAGVDALAVSDIAVATRPPRLLHDIVRATLYAEVPLAEREAGHRQAARMLAARHAAPEQVATHLLALAPSADAFAAVTLRRAAAAALARGAPESAVAFLQRALEEAPLAEHRGELLRELGAAELMSGGRQAVDHIAAAFALADDPLERARVARMLAFSLVAQGDLARAIELLEETIAVVSAQDPDLALQLEAELATHAKFNARLAVAARRRLPALRGRATAHTVGGRMILGELALEALFACAPADEVAELAAQSLTGASGVFESAAGAAQFYQAVYVLLSAERFVPVKALLAAALGAGRERGSAMTVAVAAHWQGRLAWRVGSLDDVEADSRLAFELSSAHGISAIEPGNRALLIEALLERGDLAGAESLLAAAGLSGHIPDGLTFNFLLEARAAVRIAQARYGEALADLEEFARRERGLRAANPATSAWRSHAAASLRALGRVEEARGLAADDVARARRFGAPCAVGVALHCAGVVEGGETGITYLVEAARILAASPARLAHARALEALGESLRRLGRPADARAPLRQALALADSCRATTLRDRAHHELLAAGGRPPRPTDGNARDLSASESRIAKMAADGKSNRQIAQALFLSLKTVEMHLSHSYRKLGIHSRTELHRALSEDLA